MMADVLIVDDEPDIRTLLGDILVDEGHATRMADTADSALDQINERRPDLIILDIWLQGSRMDGIEVLKTVKRDNPDIPVLIISGHGNIEVAVAAIRQGAYDFIEKPFKLDYLLVTVARALEASRLRRENSDLKSREFSHADMIGKSQPITMLRQALLRAAPTGSRIMFFGPSGAGKEIAARFLHSNSKRAEAPFVVVNSATIEPQNMEQVLFGEERDGVVTPGLMERAHGGTLFLDEVADMPMGTQSKILRVLVDQSFTRVGGANQVRVDLRIVSATTRDILTEIAGGHFREDLYHRLNVVPIQVPALSDRRDDIPTLVEHFVERLMREQGLPLITFGADAIAALQAYAWPGNVRQLKNIIERVMILSGPERLGGQAICADDLPPEISGGGFEQGGGGIDVSLVSLPLREAREAFEREYLIAQINRFGGNISRTAEFVGMERSALHRKLKSLGVVTSSKGGTRLAVRADEADETTSSEG
ncbi:MAG: sigma-54 dependent transcriptional regulator [Neomegalonema sp.]|nr:sigma-54 dependent transcriptional regulator [Neomegalonema sp.]